MRPSGPAERAGDGGPVAHVDAVGHQRRRRRCAGTGGPASSTPTPRLRRRGRCRRAVRPGRRRKPVGRVRRAVGGDGERGQSAAGRLGDDQRLPSGVMTMPLGKSRSSATTETRVVGIDAHDDAALARLRTDVGAPGVVDDHVAEIGGHQSREVGDDGDACRRRSAGPAGPRWRRSAACRRGGIPGRTARGRAGAACSSTRRGRRCGRPRRACRRTTAVPRTSAGPRRSRSRWPAGSRFTMRERHGRRTLLYKTRHKCHARWVSVSTTCGPVWLSSEGGERS